MVDVTHDGDHRRTKHLLFWIVVVGIVEQSLQLHLFLLTRVDEQHFCANFDGKQLHLFVGKRHGCCHHFTVLHQEANYVGRCAIELRRKLLGRRTAFDDNDAFWHWRVASGVAHR